MKFKNLILSLLLLIGFNQSKAQVSPCDSIQVSISTQIVGKIVYFKYTYNKGTVISTLWNFNDSLKTQSKDASTKFEYPKFGVFEPCVTVTFKHPYDTSKTCVRKVCKRIELTDPCASLKPDFGFKLDTTTGKVSFEGTTISGATYTWNFGNGSTGSGRIITHTFSPGTYTVCLKVSISGTNCTKTICKTIEYKTQDPCAALKPEFTYKVDSTGKVSFVGSPNDTNYAYYWEFGDSLNGKSNDRTPTYTYKKSGQYVVCFKVYNTTKRCYKTVCKTIGVNIYSGNPCEKITADFHFYIDSLMKGSFEAVGIGYDSYTWTFGNTTGSTGRITSFQFKEAGTYTVCLKVKKGDCVKTICKTVIIKGKNPCENTKADWGYVVNGSKVTFEAYKNPCYNYKWTFNGLTKNDRYFTYDFARAGTYTVCLAVTDTCHKCEKTLCKTIVIKNTQPDPCEKFNPKVSFTLDGNKIKLSVSEVKNGTYEWSFGDGSRNSTKRHTTHTYLKPGTYTICVTVYDRTNKCKKKVCFSITIGSNIKDSCYKLNQIDFSYTVKDKVITFEGTTMKGLSYKWDFGDKTSESGRIVTHTYGNYGSYTVCLTVIDSLTKCKKTICRTIYVSQKRKATRSQDIIQIYPNPVQDILNINSTNSTIQQVIIQDAMGKQLYLSMPNEKQMSIDVNHLSKGIYFITIKQQDQLETIKFVK